MHAEIPCAIQFPGNRTRAAAFLPSTIDRLECINLSQAVTPSPPDPPLETA